MRQLILFFSLIFISFLGFAQPTNLSVTNINPTDVTLHWDNGGCTAGNYFLRYKEDGAPWNQNPSLIIPNNGSSETYILSSLNTSTTYNWRIKCGNTGSWIYGADFTTGSCSSLSQSVSNFNNNPLYGYGNQNQSVTNLSLANTGSCDINIRPEFIISHQDSNIQQGDITLKFENPGFPGIWTPLPYTIIGGNAIGFWNYPVPNDPTGIEWTQGAIDTIAVKVHFNNANNNPNPTLAPLGIYTAIWTTQEVDTSGIIIQTLAQDSISLSLTTCSASPPATTITGTNITCHGDSTGNATVSLISSLNYCTSAPGDTNNSNIELVSLTGNNGTNINNNTSGMCDSYEDYTSQSATLSPGQSYSINVNLGTCNIDPSGALPDSAGVFIDWNQDGDFDDLLEKISTFGGDTSPSSHNITFNVPNIAVPGATRMRVVSQAQANNASSPNGPVSACAIGSISPPNFSQPWSGATEDYTIMISGSTYLWSNGATTQQITNVPAGTYTCTVTNNGCSNTASITLTEPSAISVIENTTDVSCNADSNGTATITPSGGTGMLNVNWNGMIPNALPAGTHTYTITDVNLCVYSDSVTIAEPSAISVIENTTDVSCNADSNGTATITPSGGTGMLNINWNGMNPNGLPAGTHIYIVIDSNLCAYTDSVTIVEPSSSLEINLVSTLVDQTSCSNPNGSINISVSGGTPNYNYSWSNGDTTQDLTSLIAGTYSIIVIDQNACTNDTNFTINLATTPISISFTTSNYNGAAISCYDSINGSITANVSGGIGQLNYLWSTGEVTSQINNLGANTYSLTITDSVGCINIDSIVLAQPNPLNATLQFSQTSCVGASNISISLNITGGTSGYIEDWGTTNPDTVLVGDTCIFTVTDTNSCSLTDTFMVNLPPPLIVNGYETDVLCHGDSSGAAAFVVSGGFPPYSYLWSNGDINPTAINLTAGTYSCIISDGTGCSYIDSLIVSEPLSPLTVIATVIDSINCFGDNTGSASIIASGGMPFQGNNPYTYFWEDSQQSTTTANNLYSGYNIYLVTDDNGCTLTDSIFIAENDSIFTTNTLTNYNGFNVSCNGENNGSINITINGGISPFFINWSNGNDSTFIDSLFAGVYHLSITDTLGCAFYDTISLIEPAPISLINYSQTNVSCNGYSDGSFSFYIDGGIADYILTGLTNDTINELDTLVFNNIAASSNIINIIDQNGCIAIDSIIITEPGAINPILSISNYNGVNISCKGFNDGYINIDTITGGNSPYNITWIDLISGDTMNNTNVLTVGLYNLTIIDSLNCSPIYDQDIFITEPNFALDSYIDSASSNVSCNSYCDGKLISTAFDGTAPYSFNWIFPSGNTNTNDTITNLCPGNYSLIITDANGCINQLNSTIIEPSPLNIVLDLLVDATYYGASNGIIQTHASGGNGSYSFLWNSGQNTANINGLAAGQYELAINDQLGCVDTALFTISEPAPISVNFDTIFSSLSTSCFDICDGSIYINPVISPPASYTCYWEGPNGFTSTNEDITNLCAGTYLLQIITLGDSVSFIFEIVEPQLLTTSLTSNSITCYGSSALVTAYTYGGTTPYNYSWSSNNTNNLSAFLSEGNHYLTVTDANGCIAEDSTILTNPDTMDIQGTITAISCNNLSDGQITVTHNPMAGGTPPYLYSIDNFSASYNSTGVFSLLSAGNYTITVQDNNGCEQSFETTILNPPPINYQTVQSTDSVSCFGDCNGLVIFDYGPVQNGIPTEQWSGGAINGDLCPGIYSCTFIDDNGCTTSINNVTIVEPPPIAITFTSTGTTCHNNGNDGLAVAAVAGGTPFANNSYSYLWGGNGSTSNAAYGLNPGPINCIVEDANGCIAISSVNIDSNPTPFLIGISYIGDTLLTVDIASGGTPISYIWNTLDVDSAINPVSNGQYWVIAIDSNGCISDTAFYFVNNHPTLDIVDLENIFKIYPNPTEGEITILSEEYIESIAIFNNLGKKIYFKNLNNNVQKQYKINISENAKGIYTIRAKVNNQIVNHKIILQ